MPKQRRKPTARYEIIVVVEGKTTRYFRFGRWDAELKRDEERNKNIKAIVTILSRANT